MGLTVKRGGGVFNNQIAKRLHRRLFVQLVGGVRYVEA